MERNNRKGAPSQNQTLRESPALIRELTRAMVDEINAITQYTYGQILLQKTLPVVADLFSSIARTEMRHYHGLGGLLHDLGVSHAPNTAIRNTAYTVDTESDPQQLSVARRMLNDRIRDEKNASETYRRLAESAVTEQTRGLLTSLSGDEAGHAAALAAMEKRLAFS
ncbi:MAG: hypothetical protein IJX39_02940 [Clostridia bacterium]|nr:hypothetical protein [Clostridia bacterium]